ncbi:MAG: class I SAM-dependent methyltransferase [Methanobacterium sp.]|uniref:class I SAM-dependent methyltransferase n=1 Tax=Methanobacterium sp. TaxID=2164 RepID=UPI003D64CA8B|nr:class I SAM-dependent methyltransferase [Methanobacterium sp.]
MNNNEIWDVTWEKIEVDGPRPFLEYKMSLLKPFLETDSPKHVLDVGCGDGFFTLKLLNLGYKVDATDVSPEAIKATERRIKRNNAPNINLYNENLLELNPPHKYDVIICLEVLEHIEDDLRVLKLFNSWLKKEGLLILSVPHRQDMWNYTDEIGGHYRRYSKEDLKNKLESAEFKVEDVFDYGFPIIRFFANRLCAPAEKMQKSKINPPKNNFLSRTASTIIQNACKIDTLFINKDHGIDIIAVSKKI